MHPGETGGPSGDRNLDSWEILLSLAPSKVDLENEEARRVRLVISDEKKTNVVPKRLEKHWAYSFRFL